MIVKATLKQVNDLLNKRAWLGPQEYRAIEIRPGQVKVTMAGGIKGNRVLPLLQEAGFTVCPNRPKRTGETK